jgi:hypothetical protein
MRFSSARGTDLLLVKAQICFRERHTRASRKKKRTSFLPFARHTDLLLVEARICFRERQKNALFSFRKRHRFTSRGGTEKEKMHFFYFILRDAQFTSHEGSEKKKNVFFLPREARLYFRDGHSGASWKRKNMFFFPFARGLSHASREERKKKHARIFFFRERHIFASRGGRDLIS